MSWNEPGGDKKDPWSGRGDKKGPPDLDEAIRSLQEKLAKFFGGGNGGNGDNEGSPKNFSPSYSIKSLGFLAGGAVVLWGLSGFYIVDEGNHGVETRFGKYIGTTQSGLNWHLPAPVERVEIVNVKPISLKTFQYHYNVCDVCLNLLIFLFPTLNKCL